MRTFWDHVFVPYWKFLPILATTVLALLHVWLNRQGKARSHLITITVMYFVLAGFQWLALVMANSEATAARQDTLKAQQETRKQLDRMEGRLGGEEAMQRYLDAERALVNQVIDVTTRPAVAEFYSSLAKQKQLRAEVLDADKKLLSLFEMRFRPVYDLIVGDFDTWVDSLKQRGLIKINEDSGLPPVVIGPPQFGVLRSISYKSDNIIMAWMQAASIDDGRLEHPFVLRIIYMKPGGAQSDLWQFSFDERTYSLTNAWPSKFAFENFYGTKETPISDPELIKAINSSLNQVMTYVALEANPEAQSNSQPNHSP